MPNRLFLSMTVLGLALVLCTGASAYRATDARVEFVPAGTEWIAGHGDTLTQSHVVSLPAGFETRYGDAWTHRLAGPNGLFRHLWGEGIVVDPAAVDDEAAAWAVAAAFWAANADLLPAGVTVADLKPWSNVQVDGVRYVSHHQTLEGTPVLRASTFVAIRDGRLFWLGVRCFPADGPGNSVVVSPDAAVATAVGALRDMGVEQVTPSAPQLAVMPLIGQDRLGMRLAHVVELVGEPVGRWTAYVDAQEDVVLALRDERLFMTGTVELMHYDRNPAGGRIASPASYLRVNTDDGQSLLDVSGSFSDGGNNSNLDLEIRGQYANVNNLAGNDLEWAVGSVDDGDTTVWDAQEVEFDEAQINAYRFHADVHDFSREIAPDIGWVDDMIQVNVNYNDNCNAWFDGDITFLRAGGQCNNTALVGDVIYHEFGHGFHYASIIWGVGDYSGDVGEGYGDALAFLITEDHVMSPGFMTSGAGIRDVEPDQVWPDDVVGEVHYDGLIVGGAVWDLRKILIADLGEQAGKDVIHDIFAGMVKITTDIPSSYEAALVSDDDNGNLDDGTPHVCEIDAAFGPHGLVAGGLGALLIDFDPPTLAAEDVPIPVEVTVAAAHPECAEASIGEVRLVYSVDDGDSWHSLVMTDLGNDEYTGEIPATEWGTRVRYRIEVDDNETGSTIQRPRNPADPAYYLYVGDLEEIFCDDFEGGEGDFTHELIQGEQTEGADDWMLGDPAGKGGDPDDCHSGGNCWGNDLALDSNWDGQYQNNRVNTLRSGLYDLSGYNTVRLQFRRWLQVEDAVYDHGKIYLNDEEVWDNAIGPGDVHHVDSEWILFDLDITEWAAGESDLEIRWEIQSDQGLQFGGWNIDDLCLYSMTEGTAGDDDSGDDDDVSDDDTSDDDAAGDDDVILGDTCECRLGDGRTPVGSVAALLGAVALLVLRRRAL